MCDFDRKLVVAGVTSWGRECSKKDKPGIYTKTSSYIDWIIDVIKGNYDCNKRHGCFIKNWHLRILLDKCFLVQFKSNISLEKASLSNKQLIIHIDRLELVLTQNFSNLKLETFFTPTVQW